MKAKLLFITLILFIFPIKVDALYTVEHITKDTTTKISDYEKYEEAYSAMNSYNSTASDVAVIKENGRIVNAKYAIVRFKYDQNFPFAEDYRNEHRLFLTDTDTNVYTTLHAAYGNDAAFLGYNPYATNSKTDGRVKVKVSGLVAWVNAPYVDIVPISTLGSTGFVACKDNTWFTEIGNNQIKQLSSIFINIRKSPTTSSSSLGGSNIGDIHTYTNKTTGGGYTWYEIMLSSGIGTYYQLDSNRNLIHYYAGYGSIGKSNLGKAPSYLKSNTKYYSFDGNYFYTNLTSMLNDYKENKSDRAVNALSPHYAYYLYLSNHSKTKYTPEDFDLLISRKGYVGDRNSSNYSAMYGQGINFIKSQNKYGVNALMTFSAAVNESDYGTSSIAKGKNNLFGHGAFGSNIYDSATSYNTVEDSIMAHGDITGKSFNSPLDYRYYGGHYGNKNSGMNVLYATDPYWGEKAANNAFASDNSFGLQEFGGNTLGVTTKLNVNVKKLPTYSSDTIYTLKNINKSVKDIPLTVIDKVEYNNQYWYKVYTDVALDDNQNINTNVNYDFNKSYGYINEDELYVSNNQPVITAFDKIVNAGDENFDLFKDVTATDKEDGNITSSLTIDENDIVKINVPGDYYITYTATDNSQFSVSKKIKVTVIGSLEPTIEANDLTLTQYKEYDLLKDVKAIDGNDGDITDKIRVENGVNIKTPGTYKVKYIVTNSLNKETVKEINVTVVENEKPVIAVTNKEIKLDSKFDPLDGVTATDKEDGKLDVTVESSSVDTTEEGKYIVIYSATDKDNQKTVESVYVNVVKTELLEKEGLFYLDYLQEVDGQLSILGYNTINGIDNKLDTEIEYYVEFVDIETSKVMFTKPANRVTDKKLMSIPVYSVDGKDYEYSWFDYKFDLKNIESGNYRLNIVAKTDKYFSKNVISNRMFVEQTTNFESDKIVTTRNNYSLSSAPVEFLIRDEEIAPRTTDVYTYNQFNQYFDMLFKDDKLFINGTSYSYGMDLSTSKNVKRSIIFENKENFEKTIFDIGSTTGIYVPVLPVTDNLKKDYAWYEKSIDLSQIEEGVYNIYISTEANISDYSEFNDLLNREMDDMKLTLNNKEYSFNLNKFNNIELIVKNV